MEMGSTLTKTRSNLARTGSSLTEMRSGLAKKKCRKQQNKRSENVLGLVYELYRLTNSQTHRLNCSSASRLLCLFIIRKLITICAGDSCLPTMFFDGLSWHAFTGGTIVLMSGVRHRFTHHENHLKDYNSYVTRTNNTTKSAILYFRKKIITQYSVFTNVRCNYLNYVKPKK